MYIMHNYFTRRRDVFIFNPFPALFQLYTGIDIKSANSFSYS